MDFVTLNSLHLDDVGYFNNKNFSASHIALTDAQIDSFKEYIDNNALDVIVEVGQGLNRIVSMPNSISYDPCNNLELSLGPPQPRHVEMGVMAEMNILNRLINKGIIISELSVDGPFLRLIAGSKKELACGARAEGYSTQQTVLLTMYYIKMLKTRVEQAQRFPVRINLVVNLPNWQFDALPAVFPTWWQTNSVNFREVYKAFIRASNFAPNFRVPINSVIVDYPYNFTETQEHRSHFLTKMSRLAELISETNQVRDINNVVTGQIAPPPHLSIIANTSGEQVAPELTTCVRQNSMPFLTPFAALPRCSSSVLPGIEQAHRSYDCIYRTKTEHYLNLIKTGLPRNVRIQRIYLQSWHMSPRYNSEYGVWGVDFIDKLFFNIGSGTVRCSN